MTAPVNGAARTQPRRVIATYDNYRDAERAVDLLSDEKYPVERVTIVGRDLELVEHVTGRFSWPQALLRGALTGAITGLLIGWLFAIFDWFDPIVAKGWLIVDGLWFGTLVGLTMGAVSYALTAGRRDFASIPEMRAKHYDLLVDADHADEALRVLARVQSAASAPAGTPAGSPS
jgi:hypothetical protein